MDHFHSVEGGFACRTSFVPWIRRTGFFHAGSRKGWRKRYGAETMTRQLAAADQNTERNANALEAKCLTLSIQQEEQRIGILTIKEIFGMMRNEQKLALN